MEEIKKNHQEIEEIKLPCGEFCSNCGDGCIYWNPNDRDFNGRQWCSWYSSYYYPRERQGCLTFTKEA